VPTGKQSRNLDEIMHSLEHPSWDRLFHVYDALSLGVPIESVRKATKIDRWFLNQIMDSGADMEIELRRYSLNTTYPEDFLLHA
jgi:carbamoyl-phosphate synthase large subunit